MIKIKHIDKKGNQKLINANKGLSLLEVSKNNNINLEKKFLFLFSKKFIFITKK